MTNHTYRVIEIVGTSPDGIDAAIRNGLARAAETTRGLDWFDVQSVRGRLEDGPRRTLPGDAKGRLPARGRLVDRLARQRLPAHPSVNSCSEANSTATAGWKH